MQGGRLSPGDDPGRFQAFDRGPYHSFCISRNGHAASSLPGPEAFLFHFLRIEPASPVVIPTHSTVALLKSRRPPEKAGEDALWIRLIERCVLPSIPSEPGRFVLSSFPFTGSKENFKFSRQVRFIQSPEGRVLVLKGVWRWGVPFRAHGRILRFRQHVRNSDELLRLNIPVPRVLGMHEGRMNFGFRHYAILVEEFVSGRPWIAVLFRRHPRRFACLRGFMLTSDRAGAGSGDRRDGHWIPLSTGISARESGIRSAGSIEKVPGAWMRTRKQGSTISSNKPRKRHGRGSLRPFDSFTEMSPRTILSGAMERQA